MKKNGSTVMEQNEVVAKGSEINDEAVMETIVFGGKGSDRDGKASSSEAVALEQLLEKEVDDDQEFNFISLGAKQFRQRSEESGVITVVNPVKNTKCLRIKNEVFKELGYPAEVQIVIANGLLAVGEKLPVSSSPFRVRKFGPKSVIYSSELVKKITSFFELDFSNGKTSRTFQNVEYKDVEGVKVALFDISC